jgi:hypothetical protein
MKLTSTDCDLLRKLFAVELHQRCIGRLLDALKLESGTDDGDVVLSAEHRALLSDCLDQIRVESGAGIVAAALDLGKRLRSDPVSDQ